MPVLQSADLVGCESAPWATHSFKLGSSSNSPLNIRLAIMTVESYGFSSRLVR